MFPDRRVKFQFHKGKDRLQSFLAIRNGLHFIENIGRER